MSKLDDLINKLCPDGVEYKNFFDVCDYIRGITYSKTDEINIGTDGIKVLRANNITLESNTLNFSDIKLISNDVKIKDNQWLKKDDILICAGSGSKEHIGKVAFVREDLKMTFGGFMGVIRSKFKFLNSSYLFHILTSQMFKKHLTKASAAASSTINNINNDTWNGFEIPVPPLEIQNEIVRILDNFTELEEELEEELEARRKQYEYYRDSLLTFDDSVEWKTLGEISTICDTQRKPITSSNRIKGDIPYYGASGIVDYVKDYIFDGDYLLISEDGANLLSRTYPIAFSISGKNWVNNHAHVVSFDNMDLQKYVEIYLNAIDLSKYISKGAQPKLNQQNLLRVEIPVPEEKEVSKIVKILTNFYKLCNDITSGLPAEIEARHKQYEYYRDKLLTFKMKNER